MPSNAMLAGSGTVTGGTEVGGAASVKAELTEKLPNEPLRFRLAMTLAGDGSNADKLPAGENVPRNSTVIDSLPVPGATNWSVFWADDAAKVPPLNEAEKLLGLATTVGEAPPGIVKLPMVTAIPDPIVEKLLVEPGWVVAFVTEKLVLVRSDWPVSLAPSEKASDPVIGMACAVPTQAKDAAAIAVFMRVRMSNPYFQCLSNINMNKPH